MDSIFIVRHRAVSQHSTFPLCRPKVTPAILASESAAREGVIVDVESVFFKTAAIQPKQNGKGLDIEQLSLQQN